MGKKGLTKNGLVATAAQETKFGDVFDYTLKRVGGARERKKAKGETHRNRAAILAAPLRFGVVNRASGTEVLRGGSRREFEAV